MSEERAEYKSFGEGLIAGIKSGAKIESRITALEQVAIYSAMLALLKRLEQKTKGDAPCPVCGGLLIGQFVHCADCELGQLIRVLESILEK